MKASNRNSETVDTIAAQATAPGQAGVGIIRVSGPNALAIAEAVTSLKPTPRTAHYTCFFDQKNTVVDQGLVLYFKGPHSFTGEDVVEFQGHGGQVILDILLKRILQLGARMARPGEFSERAFLNDKIDLAQAEAIADLIAATSEQAARSAVRSLQGDFSQHIHALVEQLIALRMYVEAAIDFPEEEIDFLADSKVADNLQHIKSSLNTILRHAQQGALLRDGVRVALVGLPNAGKSSLLNSLTGQESAIVTAIPGTTRDVLREHILLDGLPLHIVDTAGLRHSDDVIEQEGVKRAGQEMDLADVLLMVVDHSQPNDIDDHFAVMIDRFAKQHRLIVVRNKIDLTKDSPVALTYDDTPTVLVSAKTKKGLNLLSEQIKKMVGFQEHNEGNFIARRRHLDALQQASEHVNKGEVQLQKHRAGELLAEECRLAQQALSTITGEFRSDDLLGRIFSEFCIGK